MRKQRYPLYRLSLEPVKKELMELGALGPLYKKLPMDQRWDFLFSTIREDTATPSIHIVSSAAAVDTEYRWWSAKRPVYYVEDPSLPEKVARMAHDVRLAELVLPKPAIAFAFPEGVEVEGKRLRPILFGCVDCSTGRDPRTHRFSMIQNMDHEGIRRASIVVRANDLGTLCSTVAREEEWVKVFNPERDPSPPGPNPFSVPMDRSEAELISVHARVAVGLALYMRVYPESIREGFPKDLMESVVGVRSQRITTVPGLRGEVSPHWRSGHWRTLRDPKYYGGKKPEKLRIIHVKGTVVRKGELEPRTIVE